MRAVLISAIFCSCVANGWLENNMIECVLDYSLTYARKYG